MTEYYSVMSEAVRESLDTCSLSDTEIINLIRELRAQGTKYVQKAAFQLRCTGNFQQHPDDYDNFMWLRFHIASLEMIQERRARKQVKSAPKKTFLNIP